MSEKEVEEIERDIKKHQMKTNTKLSQIEQKKRRRIGRFPGKQQSRK